jgi:hypothetical protein
VTGGVDVEGFVLLAVVPDEVVEFEEFVVEVEPLVVLVPPLELDVELGAVLPEPDELPLEGDGEGLVAGVVLEAVSS